MCRFGQKVYTPFLKLFTLTNKISFPINKQKSGVAGKGIGMGVESLRCCLILC